MSQWISGNSRKTPKGAVNMTWQMSFASGGQEGGWGCGSERLRKLSSCSGLGK